MKKILIPLLLSVLMWGCSARIDTANLNADQRLDYAMKLYNNEDYEEAVKEFQAIVLQYPGNAVVDDAQYYLGMTRYNREEYILAAYEFSKLIKNIPASEFVPKAQFMLADCYYQLSPIYSLDQKYTKKSIEEFQAFIDFFPTNEKVTEAEKKIVELNDKLAHKEYNTAYIYEKLEDYKASLIYLNNVIDTYHDTKYAPMAMYKKVMILADKNHDNEALETIDKFLANYPDNQNAKELRDLKTKLEQKLSAVD